MGKDQVKVKGENAVGLAEAAGAHGQNDSVEALVAGTLAQLRGALGSSQVVGEPLRLGDTTVIPLLSVGFGFGAGRADAKVTGNNGGQVGIGAGGGGVRPIAMIIAGPDGVHIEPVASDSALERLAAAAEDKLAAPDKPRKE